MIVHLGMSGRLWLVDHDTPAEKHDHFDLVLANGKAVRLRDPRRFGLVLWHTGDVSKHPLFASLGPALESINLTAVKRGGDYEISRLQPSKPYVVNKEETERLTKFFAERSLPLKLEESITEYIILFK